MLMSKCSSYGDYSPSLGCSPINRPSTDRQDAKEELGGDRQLSRCPEWKAGSSTCHVAIIIERLLHTLG